MTQPQLDTHLNPGEAGFTYGASCDADGCNHEAVWHRVIVSTNPTAYEFVVHCNRCDGRCTSSAPCLDCTDAVWSVAPGWTWVAQVRRRLVRGSDRRRATKPTLPVSPVRPIGNEGNQSDSQEAA